MKVIAAYLLAVLGGNANPSAKDLKAILGSVGIDAADERIELLLSQVRGKDIAEILASGRDKLASVPAGGGVAVSTNAAGSGDAAAQPAPKLEEKVEEEEESDEEPLFGLFD